MVKIAPIHPMPPKPEYNMPFVPAFSVSDGTLLFLAGCGPIPLYHHHPHDPVEERQWMSGGFRAQYDRTMANIEMVLASRNAGLANIVKLTVYLTDMSLQNQLNEAIFGTFGRENPPPRTLVGAALSHQDMLIEIDAIAAI